MTADSPERQTPAAPRTVRLRRLWWLALGAVVALILAVALGQIGWPWALGLCAGLVIAAGWLSRSLPILATRSAEVLSVPQTLMSDPISPLVFEVLLEPTMVVSAREADDLSDRRVIRANAAARDLFRMTSNPMPLVSLIRDPQVLEAVDEALFGGQSAEAPYSPPSSRDRIWMVHARFLREDASQQRLAIIEFRDITDARRTQQARADFLANASHELRTPLASLSGFIETLLGHAKDDVAARDRFLRIMQTQAERMSRLINDLMSLSRIELDEHIAPSGEVDLSFAAADVIDALGPIARERSVSFLTDFGQRHDVVAAGDRDQVVQVAQNLIENALKYTPDGGQVTVRTFVVTGALPDSEKGPDRHRHPLLVPEAGSDQKFAVLEVTDQGPGIAREHLPRLTERFYRVEGQKSGERSGTGLGLAIVKHITNRHGGGLQVDSALGHGSSFTVWLPQKPQLRDVQPARPSL